MKKPIFFIVLAILTFSSFAALVPADTAAEIEYGQGSEVLGDPDVVIRGTSQADNSTAINLLNSLRNDDNVINWYIVYPDAAAAAADGVNAGDLVSVAYKGMTYDNVKVFITNMFDGAGGLDTIIANNTTIFFQPGEYAVSAGSAVYTKLYKLNLSLIGLDDTPDSPSVKFDMGTDSSGRNLRNIIESETYIANILFDAKNRHMISTGSANHNYIHIGTGKSNIVFDNVTITNQPGTSLLYGNNVAINILGVDNVIFNNVTLSRWSAKTGYGPIQVTNGGKNVYFNNLKLDTVKGSQAFIKIENGTSNDSALPFTSVHFTNGLSFANMSENEKRIYIESYIYSALAFPSDIYRYAQLKNENGTGTTNFITLAASMPSSSNQYAVFDLKDNTFVVKKGDSLTAKQQIQTIIDTVSFIRKVKTETAAEAYNIKYEVGANLGVIELPEIKVSSQFQSGSKDYTGYWENIKLNIIPVENRNNDIRVREVFVFDRAGHGSKINLPASENRYRIFNIDFDSVEGLTIHEAVEGILPVTVTDPYEYLYGTSNNLTYAEYCKAGATAIPNSTADTFQSCIFTSLVNHFYMIAPFASWYVGDTGNFYAVMTYDNNNSFTHAGIVNEASNKDTSNDDEPVVKWFSTDTTVATIDIDTGEVELVGIGYTTIVAKAADKYNDGEIEKPWAAYFLVSKPILLNITYYENGGDGSIPSDSVMFGSPLTLSSGDGFSKTGYELKGWNTSPDGKGTSYPLSHHFPSFNSVYDLDLYAQWGITPGPAVNYSVTIVKGPHYTATRGGMESYYFTLPAGGSGEFSVTPQEGWTLTLSIEGNAVLTHLGRNNYRVSNIQTDIIIEVSVTESIPGTEGGGGTVEGGGDDGPDGPGTGGWALANLILALATIIGGVFTATISRERTVDGLGEVRSKKSWTLRTITAIAGLISVMVFIMTEDWTLPLAMVDKWTIFMVIVFFVGIVSASLSFRYDLKEPEERETL